MSGPEHLPPDDRELEEFLAGQGPQLARYRAASREQPPPALDAQVLAQARAALPARRGVLQGWRLPLSLAATLVLGFGLLSRVQREPLPPAVLPAQQADGAEAAMLASGSAAAPLAEQQAAATARPAEAARSLAEAARRDQDRARARAALSANQAAMASARQREAEASAKQAAAVAAVPPPVLAQAEPTPTPTPTSTPAPPSPPPPPALMSMAPAPAPDGPGPAASLADANANANADAAVAAAPAAAWQARGPVAAKTAPRPLAQAAVATGAETAWRYRDDQGRVLELPPGRYRLRSAGGELLASGERRCIEGDREQLLGLGGEGDCRLWLEPLETEAGRRLLAGDCESDFKGEYRRLEPER
ncbi:hypothetical protein ED208_10590 [Stagnimonas aquatica]|uniref:Uncharacterized protein n=1 Tax=Stagnimonas aquatica TaxID=2689987 RepID=A0A3N0V9V6_9GAMM|nr:hypothetical protein [Stagnimonas aquatica]ROH89567.1 hypothetical protein ED208_10590 [Stagnimonas aquatica]